MTRTPDEIKKAMLHCSPVSCRSTGCPYKADTPKYEGDMPVCRMKLWRDMGCLIRQLEAERDAAVALIPHVCAYCKWYGTKHGGFFPDCKNPSGCKNVSGINTGWEWRGVQKEDTP